MTSFRYFFCHIKHFSVLRLYSQFARNKSNSTTVNFQNGYILIFCRYDNVSSKLDELFAGVRFAVFADFICLALAVANIFMAPHIRHCIEIDFRLKATFVTDVCFYSFILSLGRSVVRLLVLLAWMFCSRCHSPSERCLIFHLLFVKLNKFILNWIEFLECLRSLFLIQHINDGLYAVRYMKHMQCTAQYTFCIHSHQFLLSAHNTRVRCAIVKSCEYEWSFHFVCLSRDLSSLAQCC